MLKTLEKLYFKASGAVEKKLHNVNAQFVKHGVLADRVSLGRVVPGVAAPIVAAENPIAGVLLYACHGLGDGWDGELARAVPEMRSRVGAMLDSFWDKVVNTTVLSHIALTHNTRWELYAAIMASVGVNWFVSQAQRGNLLRQAYEAIDAPIRPERYRIGAGEQLKAQMANFSGKLKFVIESLTAGTLLAGGMQSEQVQLGAAAALATSVGLCIHGTMRRNKSATGNTVPEKNEPLQEVTSPQ